MDRCGTAESGRQKDKSEKETQNSGQRENFTILSEDSFSTYGSNSDNTKNNYKVSMTLQHATVATTKKSNHKTKNASQSKFLMA